MAQWSITDYKERKTAGKIVKKIPAFAGVFNCFLFSLIQP